MEVTAGNMICGVVWGGGTGVASRDMKSVLSLRVCMHKYVAEAATK